MEYKDYYKILEIDRNSSTEEIKKAYRKLARKYHPDVNPGDKDAESKFKEINEANQVLTDAEARAKYDRLGAQWQSHQNAEADGQFNWVEWVTGVDTRGGAITLENILQELSQSKTGGFSDFFEAIFGGMNLGQKPSAPGKGQDHTQKIKITLEESLTGTSRILRVGTRRLEVRIPKGAGTGTKVRVRGEGRAGAGGGSRGDLYLEISVTRHPGFERDGDDLRLDLPVNLYSAVLGGEAIVPTLKGKIKLKIPPETQSGRIFRLKGQGMPSLKNPEQRGDLYARVMVVLPENLTEEEIELFEELADIRGL